jgi:UDP-glucose 4-epimerase
MNAVLLAARAVTEPFAIFNVATGDYVTVSEIAQLAVEVVGLQSGTTDFVFAGGARGWKGDIPVVRLNTDRIRSLGWANRMSSKEALRTSMQSMLDDARAGKFD